MHGSQADLEFYLMKQKLSNMILRLKFAILRSEATYSLIHFMPLVSSYTSWEYQKTSAFLMFSWGVERDQWHEMGYFFQFKIDPKCDL